MNEMRSSFKKWALTLFVLNLFDMAATLYLVVGQGMQEANPLMAWLLAIHPAVFALVKILLPGAALAFIAFTAPDSKPLLWCLRIVTVIYALVSILHLYGFWITA